jgi:hypothetical protein
MRCHPRERGDPYHANIGWIPTFVGMTIAKVLVFTQSVLVGTACPAFLEGSYAADFSFKDNQTRLKMQNERGKGSAQNKN